MLHSNLFEKVTSRRKPGIPGLFLRCTSIQERLLSRLLGCSPVADQFFRAIPRYIELEEDKKGFEIRRIAQEFQLNLLKERVGLPEFLQLVIKQLFGFCCICKGVVQVIRIQLVVLHQFVVWLFRKQELPVVENLFLLLH